MKISQNIDTNVRDFKTLLCCEKNFDIVYRCITICQKKAAFFFVDGFAKDDIIEKILEFFYSIDDETVMADSYTFSKNCVPYCEVTMEDDQAKIATLILSGVFVLFVDGFDRCIVIDSRTYPQRDTAEPDKDRTFRGSKDGFVETLVLNTALIRRRIRSPQLRVESMVVGTSSKTDLAICYMEGRADEKLLAKIKKKLEDARVDSLTMNQESLAEVLIHHKWYNPFPKFKYTERPDTVAAQILEGDIVLLVDNSPSAMILPTSIFDIVEEANDYYFPPITGSYLRITRFLVMALTLLLTPTWLLLMNEPSYIPQWLSFIKLDEPANIPLIVQLLLLELMIDGLKLASLSTPNTLTTSLSMIGAIIVSDFAVKSGWFLADAMLYMAFVTIANYAQPCYELGYALKFMRLILLAATQFFGIWGYGAGILLVLILIACNKTVSGKSYLYPLIPLNLKQLKKKLLRIKIDNEGVS